MSRESRFDRDETAQDLVRCIACRTVYVKPISVQAAGAGQNCPRCGHVAWLSVAVPLAESEPYAERR